jgi:type IX secretion system PorP/SprF family membrane protein
MKTKIIAIILLITGSLYSQQDAQFTQYMYNTIAINPAYAGSRGAMSMFAVHRQQWIGINGGPVTTGVSAHTPLPKNTGLGVSINKDAIGAHEQTNVAVDFSYTIHTSETVKLSFGLKGSMNMLNIDYTKLRVYDATDVRLQDNIDKRSNPNIGAGVYLHGKKGYVGLSVPHIIQNVYFNSTVNPSTGQIAKERLHYYLISGYVFELNDNLKFKPAMLNKVVMGAPVQTDISANFMYNQKFILGAAYRLSGAISALAGFQITDQLFAGYSYDAEVTPLAKYNSGSHEIFIRYELFSNPSRVVSPRFF